MGCGTNGAWLGDNIVFHELDAHADPRERRFNAAGLKLTGVTIPKPGEGPQAIRFKVLGDRLVGILADGTSLEYERLQGAILHLVNRLGWRYSLAITAVACTPYWTDRRYADPDREPRGAIVEPCPTGTDKAAGVVPLYTFEFWRDDLRAKVRSLCEPARDYAGPALAGRVVVFRGNRYNRDHKFGVEVTGSTDTWFNIACVGTSLSKLHLLHHTAAGGDAEHATTRDEQQALLRMLVGDYCGTGTSFTADGHRLAYRFAQPWEPLLPESFADTRRHSVDARWTAGGAVCLAVPRLSDEQGYHRMLERIRGDCRQVRRLPACGAASPEYYVESANPQPYVLPPGQ